MKITKAIRFLCPVVVCCILFFATSTTAEGQEMPPRPIHVVVNLSQHLSFGAFYHGGLGGSVIIYPNGLRSATGDVVLLSLGYIFSSGLFDVFGNPGTVVSLLNGPDVLLTGSNGGTLTLQLGETYPQSPFVLTSPLHSPTHLWVGGTLLIGNPLANPPGNYSGFYELIFIQE